MRLLLYEFVTGGGCWSLPGSPSPQGSLLAEGAAMAAALSADLVAAGHQLEVLRDGRLGRSPYDPACREHLVASAGAERELLGELAGRVDGVLLIAPETGGALQQRAAWVAKSGGRLLSPGESCVALAADKNHLAEVLTAADCPAPETWPAPGRRWSWPAVSKPVDGCGSIGLRWVRDAAAADRELAEGRRVERSVDGQPASVAVLCGPAGRRALPACSQRIDADTFAYLGGRTPLPHNLSARAASLALRAVAAWQQASGEAVIGYVGVDLVLGNSAGDDVVLEINPRLTTSYVGLRRLAEVNLASAMLASAVGRPIELSFVSGAIQLSADGRWERVRG